jgi:hypothetical protein
MNNFNRFLGVEDNEHISTIRFLQQNHSDKIFFHINNEGRRTPFERYKYSLFGKIKGLPDIAIMHPKYSEIKKDSNGENYKQLLYLGLFLEIKAPEHNRVVLKGKNEGKIVKAKGKLSPEQSEILERLNRLKYLAVACFGADEAISEIKKYFSVK